MIDDCVENITTRKDQGYMSEVNSCDSGHEAVSLHDEIIPEYLNEKDADEIKLELEKTKLALQKKTLECEKLTVSRDKVEAELEDLTISLFEEANKMVYEANFKQDRAEKKLAVAEGKIEALETEISALKSIVITSTPSNPNPKSHPQLIKKNEGSPIRAKPLKQSVSELFKGVEAQNAQEFRVEKLSATAPSFTYLALNKEMDAVFFDQLKTWNNELLKQPLSSRDSPPSFCGCSQTHANQTTDCSPLHKCEVIGKSEFLDRIFKENISPCLDFANNDLSVRVSSCIHKNLLSVELTTGRVVEDSQFCSLSQTRSPCKHRIRFSDRDSWHSISQSSRNRITSVCNFFTYLRYIRQGIVNHDVEQIYWEVTNHRLEMAFATLGYYKEQV